jgi:probable phosphoglycerate mutase
MIRRRVYLMRHADVRYTDAQGRFVDPDTVSLTDEGRRQADGVREALAAIPFDRAVSSGLPRTVETAALVLAGRGLEPQVREGPSTRSGPGAPARSPPPGSRARSCAPCIGR